VDDAECVRGANRGRHLDADVQHVPQRNVDMAAGQPVSKRPAFDVLHGDEAAAVFGGAERVDDADVRVAQGRRRTGFPLEAGDPLGVGRDVNWQELEGNHPVERGVPCEIHLAHAAGAQRPHDLVAAQASSGSQ
jgi:hypothetical protein